MVTKVTRDVIADGAVTPEKMNFGANNQLTLGSTISSEGAWGGTYYPPFQHHANNQGMGLYSWASEPSGGYDIEFIRSKSATVGTLANVTVGDELMAISAGGVVDAAGNIGSRMSQGAAIIAVVDSTPNANALSIPTSLQFMTTRPNTQWPDISLELNSKGHATIPDQPSATVYSVGVSVPSVDTRIPISGIVASQGNVVIDQPNARITVPTAGRYLCTVAISFTSTAAQNGDAVSCRIKKNNTSYIDSGYVFSAPNFLTLAGYESVLSYSGIYTLAANDYIEYWLADAGTAITVSGGEFSIHLLG